ncbi:MAG: hypothetical protein ACRYGF_04245 [Janthinobacterium lividum]
MQKTSASNDISQLCLSRVVARSILSLGLFLFSFCSPSAEAQSSPLDADSIHLPADWRKIKDGVGGYPAGHMLEIAVRRTHSDKLEMFKWRSEFIAMLSAQPGPLIEREWHSISGIPANTGSGTWTGMTWWENQQSWQDMANMVFTSPVAAKWLQTLDMTLIFVKPLDKNFQLSTLSQSGSQVLELGLLVFPDKGGTDATDHSADSAETYLAALKQKGVETYQFAIYPNPTGFAGPYTVAYNKNGPPATKGERWFVYMANYKTAEARTQLQSSVAVRRAFTGLSNSIIREHSDIQVMTRTTSEVCIKKTTNECSLDPDECHVGIMGGGDTWARSCGERPQACVTSYNVCSNLSPATCTAVGGKRVDACPALQK